MGKAPLPHNKRNCFPPYPDHYLNDLFFIKSLQAQGPYDQREKHSAIFYLFLISISKENKIKIKQNKTHRQNKTSEGDLTRHGCVGPGTSATGEKTRKI